MNDLCEFIVSFERLESILECMYVGTRCVRGIQPTILKKPLCLFRSQQFEALALVSVVTGMVKFVGCKEEIWSLFFNAISI